MMYLILLVIGLLFAVILLQGVTRVIARAVTRQPIISAGRLALVVATLAATAFFIKQIL